MPTDLLRRAEPVVEHVARWVGEYRRAIDFSALQRWTKGDVADWATSVDVDIEQGVRNLLTTALPDLPIYGEEQGRSGPQEAEAAWHLDPVDGTTNFVHRIPLSAFSLGLVDAQGQAVMGLVINLFTGDEFYGRSDGLLRCNGKPVARRETFSLAGEVVLTELEGHRCWAELTLLQSWVEAQHGTLRILGSSALALAETAVGHGAVTMLSAFQSWDIAGGLALCRAAGLAVRDRSGPVVGLPLSGLVVGNEAIVEAVWANTWG